MTNYLLLIPAVLSFIISITLMPVWIRKAREIGLVWKDMNKTSSGDVAGSGGIVVVLAFVIGVLAFIAYRVFLLQTEDFLISILALLSVIFFLAGVGFLDDLLGWRKGGMKRTHRIILVALAAIPLMVINAGRSEIWIPLIGLTDFGLLYALIAIPVGIVGAATTFNFLAGFNGLEAGQGVIVLFSLAVVAFFMGNSWLTVICLCMIGALLGFYYYNRFPAQIFPGDALTYTVGGLIAIIPILGNFELVAIFFFIPYIIEVGLKLRGKLVKYSFGKPNKDGSLSLQYDKVYSLNHLALLLMMNLGIRATEKRAVLLIWLFQIIIILFGFLLFRNGIF